MKRLVFGWFLSVLVAVGCSRLNGGNQDVLLVTTAPSPVPTLSALPTPWPTPTPTETPASTAAGIPWPTSPVTITPVASLPWPTPTPTPFPQPLGDIPYSAVQILRPGLGSRVTSPFTFQAIVYQAIAPAVLYLELWAAGETEPVLLYREVLRLSTPRDPKSSFLLARKIPFEIRPAQTPGRLQVVVRDPNGLPQMQQSVFLELLKFGLPELAPRPQLYLPIVVETPEDEARLPLQGTLHIEGLALVTTGRVEMLLYNRQGRVLYAFAADLSAPDPQGYGRFAVDWPYRFTRPQDLRLVLQLYDPRFPGVAYQESVDLFFRR